MLRIYNDVRNLMCRIFNTNIVLIWRLILEEYGLDIEYIKGEKNIVADALLISPLNGNQDTTKEYTYNKETLSEINDTEEFPEYIFPISLKIITHYQRKYPCLKAKYDMGAYHKGHFL